MQKILNKSGFFIVLTSVPCPASATANFYTRRHRSPYAGLLPSHSTPVLTSARAPDDRGDRGDRGLTANRQELEQLRCQTVGHQQSLRLDPVRNLSDIVAATFLSSKEVISEATLRIHF